MQINANLEEKEIRQTCIQAHQSFYKISNSQMLKYLLSPEQQVQPKQLFFSSYGTNTPARQIIRGLLIVILNLLDPLVSLVGILYLNQKDTHSLGTAIATHPCGSLEPVLQDIMGIAQNSRTIVSGFKYWPGCLFPMSSLISTMD